MARQVETPNILDMALRWMTRYEHCIRHRNFDRARELFHPKSVFFGLSQNRADDLEQAVTAWQLEWNAQLAFTFDLQSAAIIPGPGMATVALNWSCAGPIVGSAQRHGRATFLFALFDNKRFVALHSHISENPKV